MEFKYLEPEPVSTSALKEQAPHWLELLVPDVVPPTWHKLIASFLQMAMEAWEANPPERLYLCVVQDGNHLSFSHELPANAKNDPVAVSALMAVADNLGLLSSLLLDAEPNGSGGRQAERSIKNSRSESLVIARQVSSLPSDSTESENDDEVSAGEVVSHVGSVAMVPVFSWTAAPCADGGRRRGRDADSASRIETLIKQLKRSGALRPLRAPVSAWETSLDGLMSDFPNFSSLISAVIRPHLALLSRGHMHRMNSVLVVGPPGIGKTFFAQQLAAILNVGRPMFVSMAAETNASSLAGSSIFWSNASPGRLFERLAWGEAGAQAVANPLVILDEVDKTLQDRFDPLGPLYTLLETETARNFEDQSLPDVLIDASNVRFIATANDIASIPEPLLSRTLVFHIAPPDPCQVQRVIQRIYEGAVRRLGVQMRTEVPANVMARAVCLSPREAKVRLECAIARAASNSRDHLVQQDWLETDLGPAHQKTIGFTN